MLPRWTEPVGRNEARTQSRCRINIRQWQVMAALLKKLHRMLVYYAAHNAAWFCDDGIKGYEGREMEKGSKWAS